MKEQTTAHTIAQWLKDPRHWDGYQFQGDDDYLMEIPRSALVRLLALAREEASELKEAREGFAEMAAQWQEVREENAGLKQKIEDMEHPPFKLSSW